MNRLRNKNFNSVELYWGLGAENAIFNIIEYFKLVKNGKSRAVIFNLTRKVLDGFYDFSEYVLNGTRNK